MHYIELCDTTTEEAAGLVELLKECREHRRDVKDEIIRLDAFQRNVGTSANLAKAKEALKCITGLETRNNWIPGMGRHTTRSNGLDLSS